MSATAVLVMTQVVWLPPAAGTACTETTAVSRAAAVTLARACGRPVEAVDARTETDLVSALPDGTWRLERTNRPVRLKRPDGSWAPVDTSLRFAPNGSVVPGATAVGLVFSGGGAGPLVRLTSAGRRLDVGAPFGALPRPHLDRSTATYPEVLPGVDLRLTADSEGYTEVLVVRSREAAAHPALRRISFTYAGPGLRTTVDAVGNLRVVDETGTPVFGGSPPSMWDSGNEHAAGPVHTHEAEHAHEAEPAHADRPGRRHGRRMPIEVTSGMAGTPARVSITPLAEVLRDPRTVYPVLIDPPLVRHRLAWTYVTADCGGCTFWNSSDWAQTGPIDGHTHISYFRMSMADLQYRTNIVHATFSIDLVWTASSYWKETVLGEVGPISPSTSWSHRPGRNADLGTVTVNAPASGITWTVTDRLRYASSQGWPDWTLGLFSLSDTDWAYGKLWSNNPTMVVLYNDPPHLPTVQPVTDCSTRCLSPAIVRSRTPELRATVSDPNHGQVRGDFEIRAAPSDSAALLAWTTTGPVSSGAVVAWRVPDGVFSDATYHWRVRARDELDWVSGWTAWQALTVDTTIPSNPTVNSVEYPEEAWGAPVGTRGRFTFRQLPPVDPANPGAPRISDVVEFRWSASGGGTGDVAASLPAGCTTECAAVATIDVTPTRDMGQYLRVEAVDRAGNVADTYYYFKVSPLPNRCWRWLLDETSGGTAEDTGNTDSGDDICGPIGASVSPQDGFLLGGVGWAADGAGPRGRFARFDGLSGEIYAGSVLDDTKSFTVMAWVRPADLAASNGYQTIISQPGVVVDRFALRYSKDANDGTGGWCFDMHTGDAVGTRRSACATGTIGDSTPPAEGQWVHLAGVYDAASGLISLHVMGNQDSCNGEMVSIAATGSWNGQHYFEIGLSYAGFTNSQAFAGDIDHVYAFQRPLAPSEICRQIP